MSDIIDQEIAWCESNRGIAKSAEYEEGFVAGLKQAQFLLKARAAAVPAPGEEILKIADWLENEAEDRMKLSMSRRDGAKLRNMTAAELRESKAFAEQRSGRTLDLVSTKVKDNIAYCDMQDRIAEKLETEARQLSAWGTLLRAGATAPPKEGK